MLNIKKIRPLFNRLIVTADTYEEDEKQGGLVVKVAGTLKGYQRVVAVGDSVRHINVGDVVVVNPSRYAQKQYEDGSMKDGVISTNKVVNYNFNIVKIDNVPHLLLYDNDIEYVIEDYTEDPDPEKSSIVMPNTTIIV